MMVRTYQLDRKIGPILRILVSLLLVYFCTSLHAENQKITISLQDIEIHEVMKMLSQQRRMNIVLAEGVAGKVSINLYDMDLDDAIHSISWAAGFAVEKRNGNYFIVERGEVGKYSDSGITEIRSFKVQYTKLSEVESILKKHLSSYGKITALTDRKMLVVEDLPSFLDKIERLLAAIDTEPKQILIEAKVLEVTLTDRDSFGVDWTKFFTSQGGSGNFGTQSLSNPGTPGLLFQFVGPNLELALDALKERRRLRTLSTPKLLTMEGNTAETVVGTRLGYRVTTTINLVTSESIEFLETGIILKVTPSVDQQGRILLDIHPEVSDGSVSDDGIPSKTTTQLSTRMLVPDGQTVFLGGLIKRNTNETREGVPILGDLPIVGSAFSNRAKSLTSTEVVVLITPQIVDFRQDEWVDETIERTSRHEEMLNKDERRAEKNLEKVLDRNKSEDEPELDNDGMWLLNQ
ncbi:MAG: hypothetical protein JMN26_12635 [gamma proteobacterium endosymbiont of Lamellibrachia anaximandri]|nr:hypothetical protein [gamma proteobacterium endosymbiont of Lamellibrachia anaximandri]